MTGSWRISGVFPQLALVACLARGIVLEGAESVRAERPVAFRNLVRNGDFEKGKEPGPEGWQRPDELTTHWVKSPDRKGRCIRINTDVLVSQFRKREDELAKALEEDRAPSPAPARKPTKAPKYDTVAGLDGVHFASVDIPLDPDKCYKLEVDVKVSGKASPKVWVKAYATIKSRGSTRDRVVWKKSLNCEDAGSEWKTFRMVFPTNTRIPSSVHKVRIQLYPYWPPATYWFDNVRLSEIREEELRAFEARRKGQKVAADSVKGEEKRDAD